MCVCMCVLAGLPSCCIHVVVERVTCKCSKIPWCTRLLTTSGNLLSEAHNPPEHTDRKGTNGDLLDCNLS